MSTEFVFIPREEYQRLLSKQDIKRAEPVKPKWPRIGVLGKNRKIPPGDRKLVTDWIPYR